MINKYCETYEPSFCDGKICVGCGYYRPKRCNHKKRVGIGFCRDWDVAKNIVVTNETPHNCGTCVFVPAIKENKEMQP